MENPFAIIGFVGSSLSGEGPINPENAYVRRSICILFLGAFCSGVVYALSHARARAVDVLLAGRDQSDNFELAEKIARISWLSKITFVLFVTSTVCLFLGTLMIIFQIMSHSHV